MFRGGGWRTPNQSFCRTSIGTNCRMPDWFFRIVLTPNESNHFVFLVGVLMFMHHLFQVRGVFLFIYFLLIVLDNFNIQYVTQCICCGLNFFALKFFKPV